MLKPGVLAIFGSAVDVAERPKALCPRVAGAKVQDVLFGDVSFGLCTASSGLQT